jgi:hypothetical protein
MRLIIDFNMEADADDLCKIMPDLREIATGACHWNRKCASALFSIRRRTGNSHG